ncbi:hypothetical protein DFH09DRAFT_1332556 [Mycena vulgaris]|nr:hypothetical protein DFH09DRAFT_1332556 [Mycena vulgaris]
MTTTTTTSNPALSIDSAALPQTSADEWAQNTNGILDAHETATQNVKGSFTEEHAAARSGETLMAKAKSYLSAQDDVQRAMTKAGQARRRPSSSAEPSPNLTSPRPPFATPDRTCTNLSAEAQAGSIGPPHLDSPSPSTPNADLDNRSTLVHTSGPASLHPITPLGSRFAGNLVTPPTLASPAVLDGIPPPPTSTTTDTQRAGPDVAAPSPYGVLAPESPSLNSLAPPDSLPSESHSARAEPRAPAVDADVDAKEGSPQRKPNLVQRLKEKMHVGHGHAHS